MTAADGDENTQRYFDAITVFSILLVLFLLF